MQVKIDTREKFHAITILETNFAANMTAEFENCLLSLLQNDVKNVVLILKDIQKIENAAAEKLVQIQQTYYERDSSFVICELNPSVETELDKIGLLELMNVCPTEAEASDIVHMEEIERELLDEE